METGIPDKARQFLWLWAGAVSIRPHSWGCVRLPQISLASLNRLAYFPTVATSTTKESHMTHQLCAFARGPVAAGMTRG